MADDTLVLGPDGTAQRPASAEPSPMGRGTLGRKLVIRVVALVAVVAVLLSSLTALATSQLLVGQVDDQLGEVAGQLTRSGRPTGPDLLKPGQPVGTFFAVIADDDGMLNAFVLGKTAPGKPPEVTAGPREAADALTDVPSDNLPHSATLPGLGHYRVVATPVNITVGPDHQIPGVLIVGLPLDKVDTLLLNLITLEAILTVLAMGASAIIGRTLIERSLRPLNRVAATAQEVSRLQLDKGDVATSVRVPEEDANPTSEVGRVGQAFNHMLNNVDSALAARHASEMKVRRFVADASHELRNPLAAIRGYAELTRRERDQLPKDTAHAMARVESEAERMSSLVEDLLLLARLDSGPQVTLLPTDLTEIMINAASDARVAGPDHQWTLNLPEQPVRTIGDQHQLHQVVANLLSNARTNTPPSTSVEARLAAEGDQAVIKIIDNGPGIPDDIQDQVFERFTRAEISRARTAGTAPGGSTGLGLAIVAAVVDAHHGTVQVQSKPGRTEFTIRLPIAGN